MTTPTGTVSQVPGGIAAAMIEKDREAREAAEKAAKVKTESSRGSRRTSPVKQAPSQGSGPLPPQPPSTNQAPPSSGLASGPPPLQGGGPQSSRAPPQSAAALPPSAPYTSSTAHRVITPPGTPAGLTAIPGPVSVPPHTQQPLPPSGPSTPSAAQFLASGGLGGPSAAQTSAQPLQNRANAPMVEFNHAIAFVNKIKNRFNSDPETYKQFLEILQTYQRDTRDIAEVSVTHGMHLTIGIRTSDQALQQCS